MENTFESIGNEFRYKIKNNKIDFVNEIIQRYFGFFENVRINFNLDINFLLLTIMFDSEEKFSKLYTHRKTKSIDWKITLSNWINQIESNINDNKNKDHDLVSLNVFSFAYYQSISGSNPKLSILVNEIYNLIINMERDSDILVVLFNEIAEGYLYGFKLKELKNELHELETNNHNNEVINNENLENENMQNLDKNRLKWLGTPSQFGFIINELIGKGYIEKPTGSFKNDAEFYLKIFQIKTTIGNLANEVNENKNSFSGSNAAMFKIPEKIKLK